MALDRLSPEDERILALEHGPVAGHILKVALLDPAVGAPRLELETLRAHVEARLARAPRLRQRLAATPLRLAPPVWVDDGDFDVARHVRAAAGGAEVPASELPRVLADSMAHRLERDRPLWSLETVRLAHGRCALIVKLHHCMADGQVAMRLMDEILWDADPEAANPSPQPWRPQAAPGRAALLAAAVGERARPGRSAPASASRPAMPVLRRELRGAGMRSPLDRHLSRKRAVALASAPLEELRRIEASFSPRLTVNDVALGAVAGGLRRWIEHRHGKLGDLRVKVPVSLHPSNAEHDIQANRDSFLCATLPLGEPDPRRRLERIGAETAERKRDHDAEALDALFAELRGASPGLERLAERLASSPRVFALSVSNVRGPNEPRYVLGAPVTGLYALAEVGLHHALRVAAVSLEGTMHFGLCADPGAIDDLDLLAQGIGAELRELAAGC